MIVVRLTYYPPVGSTEEVISLEKRVTSEYIKNCGCRVVGQVAELLLKVLTANSFELRQELQSAVSGDELFDSINSDEAFDRIQISDA